MLLAFEVDGYKVFDERIKFDMNANMRFRKLKENIYTKNIKGKDIHALKSAIIYKNFVLKTKFSDFVMIPFSLFFQVFLHCVSSLHLSHPFSLTI